MRTIDVKTIAQCLQLQPARPNPVGDEHIYYCPFCSGQKRYPKLYINEKKGIFQCWHCHTKGSITELWGLCCNCTPKEAFRQMLEKAPGAINYSGSSYEPVEKNQKHTDKNKLHAVYSEFFSMLSLNKKHKEDILRRGLPQEYFKKFRSLPEENQQRWQICRHLNQKYGLDGVPGFKQRESKKGTLYWDCFRSGILIPVKDLSQKITGFQVRTESADSKYIWFSYSGQMDSAEALIIPGRGIPWIIEGVLKSYVANYFLQVPCIGIPGTNTFKTSVPVDAIAGGRVIVAFDNEDNPYTEKALYDLVDWLQSCGLKVIVAGWKRDLGKGIDDACYSLYKQGVKLSPNLFLPGIAA